MENSTIKYYPVGNGDNSLISIAENGYVTTIMVDCKIRESSAGDDDKTKFDVKADLLTSLKKKSVNGVSDVSYTDIFVLTHGDDDHLHGFEKNFYQGDPKNYKQENKDAGEILIDVLWFSPMVMGESTNADEDCFNAEANRRIQLHRDQSPDKDIEGNKIVIIGYDANEDLDGLDLVRNVPGDIVTRFNDRELDTFSVFIHAPYKIQLTSADTDKNHTSVVFQARFKESPTSNEFLTLAMFGGDADHYAWEIILEKTKKYKKDVTEKALDWDVFLAPHHCSWSFFNDRPQADNPEPKNYSLEVLDYKRADAKVIASCKEIKDNDDNPPHFEAKGEYVKKIGKANFWHTGSHEVKDETPQPIVIIIPEVKVVKPSGFSIGSPQESRIFQPKSPWSI